MLREDTNQLLYNCQYDCSRICSNINVLLFSRQFHHVVCCRFAVCRVFRRLHVVADRRRLDWFLVAFRPDLADQLGESRPKNHNAAWSWRPNGRRRQFQHDRAAILVVCQSQHHAVTGSRLLRILLGLGHLPNFTRTFRPSYYIGYN